MCQNQELREKCEKLQRESKECEARLKQAGEQLKNLKMGA